MLSAMMQVIGRRENAAKPSTFDRERPLGPTLPVVAVIAPLQQNFSK
jgi:hypothetical protein